MWQIVINGPGYFDTPYDLPDGTTTLGRADENDIVLSGDLVSRKHARIHVRNGKVEIEDLGSRNGSRINGEPLNGVVPLKAGDLVNVGENTLAVKQPRAAEVSNTETEVEVTPPLGVKHYGGGSDIAPMVILAKDVRDSVVMRALDNFAPFDTSGFDVQQDQPKVAYESLVVLYKVSEQLGRSQTLAGFLEAVTDLVMGRCGATTAVVLLKDGGGKLTPTTVRHRGELGKGEVPVSDAIVDEALAKGAALAVANVRDDRRFAQRESVILYGVDQVLCVPIGEGKGALGVLYLNRQNASRDDLEALLDLCSAVSNLISAGVEKFRIRHLAPGAGAPDRLKAALERFLPPDVASKLSGELPKTSSKLTHLEEATVTVLSVDLSISSVPPLPAASLSALLEEFHGRAAGIVFSYEGTVERSLGDGLLAVFGAPYHKGDDALRAVRAALALRADWEDFVGPRPEAERLPLRAALATGKVTAGLVGTETRLEFVAQGEAVGHALMLGQSARPGQVLMTGKTLGAVGARFDVTPLGERMLKAPKDKVAVFEVMEEDASASTQPGVR